MTIQILVSTMNQKDMSLIEYMNIFADTIVINQCDATDYRVFKHNGYTVEWFDCQERGVGKSRNRALMAATADYCVFADDDMEYDACSRGEVEKALNESPKADLLVLNVRNTREIKKNHRVFVWNSYRYGAPRMIIRRDKILRERIGFSLLFGGGAKYSCGEDTLFINDCLKKNLKCYASTRILGTNNKGESTWFKGYTKKFFYDRGVLYHDLNPFLAKMYCVRFVIKNTNIFAKDVSKQQALKWMFEGTNYNRENNK